MQEQRIRVRSAVQVFGENLDRLMKHDYARVLRLSSNAKLAQKVGMSDNTIGRARRARKGESELEEGALGIDNVQKIARAFGFQAWQMLVSGFDPANPPADPPLTQSKKAKLDDLRGKFGEF